MKFIYCYSLLVLLPTLSVFSKSDTDLIAGPMQGHTTVNSAKIWFLIKKTSEVEAILVPVIPDKPKTIRFSTDTLAGYKKQFPVVVEFTNLKAETEYLFTLKLNGVEAGKTLRFTTLKDTAIADFSFLTGSCAMQTSLNLGSLYRIGSDKIFKEMRKMPGDFMLWLGDNSYYLPRDFVSAEGMWKRQIKTRKIKGIDTFLHSRPQYAIWDDHDYGSYNGDRSFPLKDTSLFLYKHFWANPSYGLPDAKGIFTSFRWYDTDFFMLDDRFYRTGPNIKDGTMLGKAQLNWLLDKLKHSDATFKFIVVGSQMLNPYNDDECFNRFPEEKKEILDFIENNNIKGVVFLTGDAHYSDLQKQSRTGTYPLYDFTCSPLTSFTTAPSRENKKNKNRIPNTLVCKRNFGKVSITGPTGNRVCSIELFNDKGKILWKHEIPEQELR